MKKQINPTIKAHLIRGAFYLLLLLAVCAIPFALAQRNATKQGVANATSKPNRSQLVAAPVAPKAAQAPKAPQTTNLGVPHALRPTAASLGRKRVAKIAARLLHPLFVNSVYMLDDGSAEDAVGFGNGLTNSQALWMNHFDVISGQTMISTISVAWGTPVNPDPSLNGMPVTIAVWSDPNGDGDPTDGLLLGSVAGTVQNAGTDTFVDYTFNPPIDVSAFTSFFIGDMTPSSTDIERFFQGIDETPPSQMQSWVVGNSDGSDVDINTIANNDLIGTIDSFGLPGNWLIRGDTGTPASPTPTSTVSPTPTGTPGSCIVVNGDFETGSLPPWTDTGDTSFTAVNNVNPHTGSFSLQSGPTASDGFIDQTIPTVAGQGYDVSFWLENDDTSGVNRFGASFGSVTLVPEATQSAFGYTLFTFTNVVPGANADLHFIFFNTPSYFYLDDVCVTSTGGGSPTPTATPSCTPIVINGSIASGDPTQTDKLAQSGIPQTCPATTTCAIFGDPNTFRYDAYTFTNTSGATQCVTIDTNTVCNADHDIFTAAYLGSFDPSNVCTNWIGDAGLSPNPDQAFQVDVDNGQTFVVVVSEVHHAGCPGYTLTVTGLCPGGSPSPTPSCTPGGGTPGPWTQAAPVAVDHYGGFMDSDGTFGYEGGGYSFSVGDNINNFARFDPVANAWTALAVVPDLNNAEASAVYAPNVNKLFVFGGEEITSATVVNTTRIYDIATGTWSTGAPMPDIRAFMASGYFNGKIYLVGGYNSGNVDPSFGQVWEYDPVANTFDTSRTDMPATLGGAGFGVANGHLYVAGGRDLSNTNLNTLYDYDIAADTWTQRANLPTGVNVPGSAVIGGKVWVFAGGDPFGGSAAVPSKKHTQIPDTTNILQVYDPASDSWTVGPSLSQVRSFPSGTDVANTAVAVGGYDGVGTITSVEINVTSGGNCSPTPTATAAISATATATATATASAPSATPTSTVSATPTATATATATSTAVASATPTATATATHTPRPTPTPRPAPTPVERTGECFFFNSTCSGLPQLDNMTCIDCIVSHPGASWEDGSGCLTTCPMR